MDDVRNYKMRDDDKEMYRRTGSEPAEGLEWSFHNSEHCWVAEDKNKIISIAGVGRNSIGGTIWIMFAADIEALPLSFFKESKKYLKFMLDKYGYLENFAEVNKFFVIKWAMSMGFTIDKPFSTKYGTFCRVHIGGA